MTYPYSKSLEHHGLVAELCKEIDLAKIFDIATHPPEGRKVSFANLFVAMMLNGLGFTGRTAYVQ